MSTHANMVKMGVTSVASAGVGTITLNAASSGYQSLGTAYGADAMVDILITEGTAWEVARNCTYTHTGTTVTRGTLESSSTGSAVVFTSAAVVSVMASADSGRRWDSAALEHVAGTDADTTMAVGKLYVVDMSAWATADRTYTLPAAAAVGSRIGIMVTSGNASYELIIKPGASDTINGGTAAAEWSRLFITGEVVILRCVTANSAWVVEYDGRIPAMCRIYRSADVTTTATTMTTTPLDTNDPTYDVGSMSNVGGNGIVLRRAGLYNVHLTCSMSLISDTKYLYCGLAVNGALHRVQSLVGLGSNNAAYVNATLPYIGAVGASLTTVYQTNDSTSKSLLGGNDTGTNDLIVVEKLK